MSKVTTAQAREQLADIINRSAYGKERIVLTRRGKPLAAIVPIEDVRLLERLEDQTDLREAQKALAEANVKGTTSLAALKKELSL